MSNTQRLKDLWMFDRQLYDFLDLLDLLIKSTNHIVSRVWHFFDLHKRNQGIDLGRKDLMQDVVIRANSHSEIRLYFFDFDGFVNVYNILAFMAELSGVIVTLTSTLFFPITLTTSPT